MDTLREHLSKAGTARWSGKTKEERAEHSKMMNDKQKAAREANKKNTEG